MKEDGLVELEKKEACTGGKGEKETWDTPWPLFFEEERLCFVVERGAIRLQMTRNCNLKPTPVPTGLRSQSIGVFRHGIWLSDQVGLSGSLLAIDCCMASPLHNYIFVGNGIGRTTPLHAVIDQPKKNVAIVSCDACRLQLIEVSWCFYFCLQMCCESSKDIYSDFNFINIHLNVGLLLMP